MKKRSLLSVLVGLALLGAALAASPISARADSGCAKYELIGLRGSSEPDEAATRRMGVPVNRLYEEILSLGGLKGTDDVVAHGIGLPEYAAVSVKGGWRENINGLGAGLHIGALGAYTESVEKGTKAVLDYVEKRKGECAATKFILAGYSQGAQAVGRALETMPTANRSLVAASVLFGDPYFRPSSASTRGDFQTNHGGAIGIRSEWPSQYSGKVFSYCHFADPICQLHKRVVSIFGIETWVKDPFGLNFDNHGNYHTRGNSDSDSRSSASHAASDVLRLIGPSLGVGSTTTTKSPVDLVFSIDTTGSMDGIIWNVKAAVDSLAHVLATESSSFRVGLVEYRDGECEEDDFGARVVQPFTTNVDQFSSALDGLSANGGCDIPEYTYSGMMTAMSLGFRDGVKKMVISIGDAEPKAPELLTGYTAAKVVARSLSIDPVEIYSITSSLDSWAMEELTGIADQTGGKVFMIDEVDEVAGHILDAVSTTLSKPSVYLAGVRETIVGEQAYYSASYDYPTAPTAYEWDMDGDGVYELEGGPTESTVHSTIGDHTVAVRLVFGPEVEVLGSFSTHVVEPPTEAPGAPQGLAVQADAADPSAVRLSWTPPSSGGPVAYYSVLDGEGRVVESFVSPPSGDAPIEWVESDLAPGEHTYAVLAGNAAGESEAVSGTVELVQETATTTTTTVAPPTTAPAPSTTSSVAPTSVVPATAEVEVASGTEARSSDAVTSSGAASASNRGSLAWAGTSSLALTLLGAMFIVLGAVVSIRESVQRRRAERQ